MSTTPDEQPVEPGGENPYVGVGDIDQDDGKDVD